MEIKKRYPPESPLLWSFHHCFTDSNDAVFYSGRDSKESAETTGSIDDSGESEKLFPSQSMTNFFGWIEVGYIFSDDRSQSGKQEHYGSLF